MDKWEGPAKFYHENGALSADGNYKNDLKDGPWKYYSNEGRYTGTTSYKDELRNGFFEIYFENGKLQQRGAMTNDLKSGEWEFYHENAQLSQEGNYKDDLGHGDFVYYHPNGNLYKAGRIENGNNIGPWKFYHENGNIKSTGNYVEGLNTGEWKYYHENGALSSIGMYENGNSVGLWKYYYDNGQLKKEGPEFSDDPYDLWVYFDEKGRKESEGYWKNGKEQGPWTFYDSLGNGKDYKYNLGKVLNFSTLYDSANHAAERGDFKVARTLINEAKKKYKQEFGPDDIKRSDIYSLTADYYFEKKEFDKAIIYYQKALDHVLTHHADTSSWYTANLSSIGLCYFDLLDYDKAASTYSIVVDLIKQRKDGLTSEVYATNVRNWTNSLKRGGHPGEALAILTKEQEYRIQHADQKKNIASNYIGMIDYAFDLDSTTYCMAIADSLIRYAENNDLVKHWTYPYAFYYKGILYRDEAQYDSARVNFQKAIDGYRFMGDTVYTQFIYSQIQIGNNYYGNYDYQQSLKHYSVALATCEEHELFDSWVYPEALHAMAKQNWSQSNTPVAYDYYSQTLKLFEKTNDMNNISASHLGIGLCLADMGIENYEDADYHYNEAQKAVANTGSYNNNYANAGVIYTRFLRNQMIDLDKSINVIRQVLSYNLKYGSPNQGYLASSYYELGESLRKLQQFDFALYYLDKTNQILEKDPTIDIQTYEESLRAIADIYETREEDYQKAQVFNLKALAVVEKYLGKESTLYPNILADVAANFSLQENNPTSILYYQESLDLKAKLYSKNDYSYLHTLVSLGNAMVENSQLAEGLAKLILARKSYEENGDELHRDYIRCLDYLGEAYEENGETELAEETFLKNLRIARKIYGEGHPEYAVYLRYTGQFFSRQNQYDLAYYYTKPAIDIIEKTYGKGLRYAWYAETMSWIHYNREEFTQSIELRETAADIYLEAASNSEYVDALYALGGIYRSMGQYQNSLDAYKKCSDVILKTEGRYSYYMTQAMMEFANTYLAWRKPSQALVYLDQIRNLYDSLGVNRWNYADLHDTFGLINYLLGRYDIAQRHFEEAINITDSIWGNESPRALLYRNNMAHNYMYRDDFETAEKLWLLAGRQYNKAEEGDLTRVKWLDNLAALYLAWNKMDLAERYWNEVIEILLKRITDDFPYLSESGKVAFWDAYNEDFEYYNSYALKASQSGNQRAIGQMYDNQLQTKSILLSTSSKERRRILNSGDSTTINNYLEYIQLKEQLARYYGFLKEQLAADNIDIPSLEQQSGRFEKVLSIDAETLGQEEKASTIRWRNIQRSLKEGEATVEIIRFRYFHKKVTDSVIYVALILTPQTRNQPLMVVLPNGNELEDRFVKAYKTSIQFRLADERSYTQFWEKIDVELKGVNKIYLASDGVFNQINIGTLLRNDGTYVRDTYDIRLLTSTRDVLLLQEESKKRSRNTAFLFGFPKYDLAHSNIEDMLIERGISRGTHIERALDLSRFGFSELPGTKNETEEITRILEQNNWEPNLYLANNALEEELKSVSNPTVLHIATHGFFLDDPKGGEDSMELGVRTDVSRENPLLRSGLLLTGAAQTARGETNPGIENGIFTAYEAMNLNLSETELVVLSACETGRGEIKNGEGVYGLQRAFQIAGARAIIMSLWKVDDNATQLLMTEFYKAWLSGLSKNEAFRRAQDYVRNEFNHPYYWGAFVLIGA